MLQKIICSIFLLLSFSGFAQNEPVSLTLQESIDLALKNNLDLKSEVLQSETSEVVFKQTRSEVLPNLNANFRLGMNNGRSIDPFTNNYINEQLTFSNAGLSLNFTVFDGFRLKNSIQRDRFNLKASEMEIKEAEQNLILNVTLAYLQVLNQKDLVKLAKSRLETTTKQLDRLQDYYDLGKGNPADYFDMKGQLTHDKTGVVQAKNALKDVVLNFSQLLNIDYPVALAAIIIPENLEKYDFSAEAIFEASLENLATFRAKELRIQAAQENISVSKALYSPEISLFGQLGTNYSSAAQVFNETGNQLIETGGFVSIGNETFPVMMNEPQYASEEILYYDQFSNNLNSVVGVAVNIPVFNGFRAKHSVELQRIKLEESKVAYSKTKSLFKKAIEEAHADMEAAYKRYHILQNQVAAYQESFRVNEIRFNNGVSNIVEYIISKNNLDQAKINLINAKYEYMLRVKVLDYYRKDIKKIEKFS